jgi:hypothetical protein
LEIIYSMAATLSEQAALIARVKRLCVVDGTVQTRQETHGAARTLDFDCFTAFIASEISGKPPWTSVGGAGT